MRTSGGGGASRKIAGMSDIPPFTHPHAACSSLAASRPRRAAGAPGPAHRPPGTAGGRRGDDEPFRPWTNAPGPAGFSALGEHSQAARHPGPQGCLQRPRTAPAFARPATGRCALTMSRWTTRSWAERRSESARAAGGIMALLVRRRRYHPALRPADLPRWRRANCWPTCPRPRPNACSPRCPALAPGSPKTTPPAAACTADGRCCSIPTLSTTSARPHASAPSTLSGCMAPGGWTTPRRPPAPAPWSRAGIAGPALREDWDRLASAWQALDAGALAPRWQHVARGAGAAHAVRRPQHAGLA